MSRVCTWVPASESSSVSPASHMRPCSCVKMNRSSDGASIARVTRRLPSGATSGLPFSLLLAYNGRARSLSHLDIGDQDLVEDDARGVGALLVDLLGIGPLFGRGGPVDLEVEWIEGGQHRHGLAGGELAAQGPLRVERHRHLEESLGDIHLGLRRRHLGIDEAALEQLLAGHQVDRGSPSPSGSVVSCSRLPTLPVSGSWPE